MFFICLTFFNWMYTWVFSMYCLPLKVSFSWMKPLCNNSVIISLFWFVTLPHGVSKTFMSSLVQGKQVFFLNLRGYFLLYCVSSKILHSRLKPLCNKLVILYLFQFVISTKAC